MAEVRWTLIFWSSFFLIITIVANNNLKETTRAVVSDSIRCYSCMSSMYEPVFYKGISEIFSRPENFSDQCRNPHAVKGLVTVDCQSICINMREEVDILGVPITGYIRGCYDRMLTKGFEGFNQTIARWYKWLQRDSCQYYNKQDILISSPQKVSPKNSMIFVCTCYSDGCNGSEGMNGAITVKIFLKKHLLTLFCVLLGWTWRSKVSR